MSNFDNAVPNSDHLHRSLREALRLGRLSLGCEGVWVAVQTRDGATRIIGDDDVPLHDETRSRLMNPPQVEHRNHHNEHGRVTPVLDDDGRYWLLAQVSDCATLIAGGSDSWRPEGSTEECFHSLAGVVAGTLAGLESPSDGSTPHRAYLDLTPDPIITVDRDGLIIDANLAAEDTFQFTISDVAGQRLFEEIIHPPWRPWFEESFAELSRNNAGPLTERGVQLACLQANGEPFPARISVSRLARGGHTEYGVHVQDLTGEKWNERRRNTRYDVTRILAEIESPTDAMPEVLGAVCRGLGWDWAAYWSRQPGSTHMGIELSWGNEGVSAAPLEIVSRDYSIEPGSGFIGDVWTARRSGWLENIQEPNRFRRGEAAIACGFMSTAAMPIIGRDEIIGAIEFHSLRQRARDDEMLRLMDSLGSQIGQYIERKQVEEERVQLLAREQAARAEAENAERRLAFLAEASAQLSASLDYEVTLSNVARLAVPKLGDYCAIDMLDEHGNIRSLEIADIDPEKEARGREMTASHPVDPESNHPVAQVVRTGRPLLFPDVDDDVIRLFSEDDEEYFHALRDIGIDSSMYVPLSARGRTIGVVSFVSSESGHRYGPSDLALAQELTRRAALAIDNARLYREAQEAVRIREEFLSIASHELKTPLTTVKGYGQILSRLLRRPALDSDRLIRLTDQLQEQLSRFETLIADLLDVSRIQQRGLELRPEPTDLVELARTVASRFDHPSEPDPEHEFVFHTPDTLTGVWDPDRLDQVLTNLISNAVKYSPDGGSIDVLIEEHEPDQVRLAVRDYGIGIPEDEQGQLFRPFARSETVQRAISGVGLGLYISQQIVSRHGGSIWVESAQGEGSQFIVLLPRDYEQLIADTGGTPEQ